MLYSLRKFDKSEIARQRMKIIDFYSHYGEKATKEAFGADRNGSQLLEKASEGLWRRHLQPGSQINPAKTG